MHTPDSNVKTAPIPVSEIRALREAISPARLRTYLRLAHHNSRRALDRYAANTRAGAALYPMLQTNEVVLRNAIDRALASQFGGGWPYAVGFLRSLPRGERSAFEASVRRVEKTIGVPRATTGDVVAAQTYWFWVMLLNARFEQRIWSRELQRVFPHAPPQVDRAVLHSRADSLRRLRNRIAHHEPLLGHDLRGAHRRAAGMIRWVCPVTATWAEARWPPPSQAPR
jgi:hypothetical protein